MLRVRQLLKHVLVAGALGRIAGALLLRQHAEPHAARAQDLEQRSQRLLEVGLERAGAAEPDEHVVLRADRRSRAPADVDELLPLVVAEAPDVAAALEVVVHRAEILGRVAVRHQAAPRADEDRQVLDADRALVLAGAAGRALPQHLLASRPRRACVSRSPASSASCVCRMIVFGFSSLPAPHAGQFTWQRPHSTQVNASSTRLAAEILDASRGRPAPSRNRGSAGCRARATSETR